MEEAERFQRWQDREKDRSRTFMDSLWNVPSANVIAEIRGTQRPDQIVVIGGHLDSGTLDRAQDDGAGVIIAMEVARLIAQLKTPPKRTLRVVLLLMRKMDSKETRLCRGIWRKGESFAAIEADIGAGKPLYFSYKVPLNNLIRK